jgi:hypothetical protein
MTGKSNFLSKQSPTRTTALQAHKFKYVAKIFLLNPLGADYGKIIKGLTAVFTLATGSVLPPGAQTG